MKLKITDIHTYSLSIPMKVPKAISTRPIYSRDFGVVEVFTDEGIVGVGYTFNRTAPIIADQLKRLVIGLDPFDVEYLWQKMYANEGSSYQKGLSVRAISMIDIALWDIIGKATNRPLYKILGGFKDRVPCYTSAGYYRVPPTSQSVNELVEEMCGLAKKGARYLKMRIGGLALEQDIKRVRAVRAALGDGVGLMVDANNAYSFIEALKMGRWLEKENVFWFEEPLRPDDWRGYRQLVRQLEIPVVSGELEYTRFGFRDIIMRGAADIIQPDACVCGGVTEWKKIVAFADTLCVPVAPHVIGDGGVNLHLAATCNNLLLMEYFEKESEISKVEELFNEYTEAKDGYVEVPKKPGLGLSLNRKTLERYGGNVV
jgi:L-alanine-DL-glutamate epimerase-like enolase superfamily enzyme